MKTVMHRLLILFAVLTGACENPAVIENIAATMVRLPGETFAMGCATGDTTCYPAEEPQHTVTLSTFSINRYEVSQAQWQAVMGTNPSSFIACGEDCPVEQVSWDDVQLFLDRLNTLTARSYRLCTEAEWEYAARAGSTAKWSCGNDEACLDDTAWFKKTSGQSPHPVGDKEPNAWELYDMSGNVWEWVNDRYGDYPAEEATNPAGPGNGTQRVRRGGGWLNLSRNCRCSSRGGSSPDTTVNSVGFRLCE